MTELSPKIFGYWIPCSQELPADHVAVLVVSIRGKQVVMYRERGVWVQGLTTAYWEPTHWMPLPSPPSMEENVIGEKNLEVARRRAL